eukprot:CAMPEP_0203673672 /NCGR_PEP_ID=MMETSP0090-20130426/13540_1 /ASSEMBLY_ACC=CAM_ASM_001088 /TAXON_ID=426623 /ORGANISM="Chaetoceros affinis, Strain CCMP159" /LENGTH=84 /DNA_ID=CAMNT_0050539377 /DNA_START=284 /DNA_END=534 /DNA_ORIENTATION=+
MFFMDLDDEPTSTMNLGIDKISSSSPETKLDTVSGSSSSSSSSSSTFSSFTTDNSIASDVANADTGSGLGYAGGEENKFNSEAG